MTRPSWTATTCASGAVVSPTSCRGRAAAREAAAAAGAGAAVEPGEPAGEPAAAPDPLAVSPLSGVALPVAVELDGVVGSVFQATCLPVTGMRPSIRPVSVAITALG